MLRITSPAFVEGETIPKKYTCDGENVSPPLEFFSLPENTASLVLLVDDPDAPMGAWNHWTIWNISPEALRIAENSVPDGAVLGTTTFGAPGYGGPCPPSGTHRYFFKLLALDKILDLPGGSDRNTLEKAMADHILAEASLMGKYPNPS